LHIWQSVFLDGLCHTSTLLRPKGEASVTLAFAQKWKVKVIGTVFHREMTLSSGTQRPKNRRVGRRRASIRMFLRWESAIKKAIDEFAVEPARLLAQRRA